MLLHMVVMKIKYLSIFKVLRIVPGAEEMLNNWKLSGVINIGLEFRGGIRARDTAFKCAEKI